MRQNQKESESCEEKKYGPEIGFLVSLLRPAIHFSYFVKFLQNTPENTKHSIYTFHISGELRVLLMPRKNKPRNTLTFRKNADLGAKYCEKPKKRRETRKK